MHCIIPLLNNIYIQWPSIKDVLFWVLLIVIDVLIIFLVGSLLSKTIGDQIDNTERSQDELRASLDELQSTSRLLEQITKQAQYEKSPELIKLKRNIHSINEELRYLSPTTKEDAKQIEKRIKTQLGTLYSFMDSDALSSSEASAVIDITNNILNLISQRKAICS